MTPKLIHRAAGQDYEFVHEGEIVGRLVWIEQPEAADGAPGWVLRVSGWPDRQMYRIPHTFADLAAARRYREAATLGLAHAIVDDRLSGLVPKPVP